MIEIRILGEFTIKEIADNSKPEFYDGGVYLWAYPHQNKLSIVYVGEAQCFSEKFYKYKNEIPNPDHYFIVPSEEDSVYSLLQEKDFIKLYNQRKLWAPGLPVEERWVKEKALEYVRKLKIFLLPLKDEYNSVDIRQTLESQIQTKLITGLKIPPYHQSNYRFGRIWKKDKALATIKFRLFDVSDQFEKNTKEILESL